MTLLVSLKSHCLFRFDKYYIVTNYDWLHNNTIQLENFQDFNCWKKNE